jgi:hypothetical protein
MVELQDKVIVCPAFGGKRIILPPGGTGEIGAKVAIFYTTGKPIIYPLGTPALQDKVISSGTTGKPIAILPGGGGHHWVEMAAEAPFLGRAQHGSVTLSDGSVLVMGGIIWMDGTPGDTWRSTDKGTTWVRQSATAGWAPRSRFMCVVLPDDTVLLMGGEGTVYGSNDVWKTVDKGVTWTQVVAHAPWAGRTGAEAVAFAGLIVIMGGWTGYAYASDVWASHDGGANWTRMATTTPWTGRFFYSAVVTDDGEILVMGGSDISAGVYDDVWKSDDAGETWDLVAASSAWSGKYGMSAVLMKNGDIIIVGGQGSFGIGSNEVWKSSDRGATWSFLENADWAPTFDNAIVRLLDNSILVTGGLYATGQVWRRT